MPKQTVSGDKCGDGSRCETTAGTEGTDHADDEDPIFAVAGSAAYTAWKRYVCTYATIGRMSLKEKRQVFALMRSNPQCTEATLLVKYGVSLGEFCTMHTLGK
jgi:hypothetical protein